MFSILCFERSTSLANIEFGTVVRFEYTSVDVCFHVWCVCVVLFVGMEVFSMYVCMYVCMHVCMYV